MNLNKAKERLNNAIKGADNLTCEEILKLSMEADKYIVLEQRARLEKLLGEGCSRK